MNEEIWMFDCEWIWIGTEEARKKGFPFCWWMWENFLEILKKTCYNIPHGSFGVIKYVPADIAGRVICISNTAGHFYCTDCGRTDLRDTHIYIMCRKFMPCNAQFIEHIWILLLFIWNIYLCHVKHLQIGVRSIHLLFY